MSEAQSIAAKARMASIPKDILSKRMAKTARSKWRKMSADDKKAHALKMVQGKNQKRESK